MHLIYPFHSQFHPPSHFFLNTPAPWGKKMTEPHKEREIEKELIQKNTGKKEIIKKKRPWNFFYSNIIET
jgi:hypothetical protein